MRGIQQPDTTEVERPEYRHQCEHPAPGESGISKAEAQEKARKPAPNRALDAETEAAVSDSLRTLHGKCTTIVIAHRLTTVQNVDTVFVFDKGEIVASGKFNDLVATNDIVARFVELSSLDPTD